MPAYHPQRIEPKWQAYWEQNKTFRAIDLDRSRPKLYILDMFPYPSGAGLHVGHPEGYTATDILCRYKRMRGFNVLHPMGWDAFGLPAEQYAVQTNTHPRITTQANIDTFRRQIKSLGFSYDWDREVDTTDPGYYKWTQWIFLKLHDTWYDPDFVWTDPQGRRAHGQGPADRRAAHPRGHRRPGRLPRQQAAGLPSRGSRQLVPGAGHGAGQRGGHRRQERARRVPGRPDAADPVDAPDHRLRRAPGRRPRAGGLAASHQGHAAQLGRPQRGSGGRFPHPAGRRSRELAGPPPVRGVSRDSLRRRDPDLHDPARHPVRRHVHGAGARASPGRPDHDARARRRGRRLSRAGGQQERPGPHRPGQDQDRRLHRRLRDQPGERPSRSPSGSPTTC